MKLIRVTTITASLRGLLKGQLRYMSENGFEVKAISSYDETFDEVESNEGIQIIPVEMTRTISPIKDIKAVWELYKIFRKEKPEIVHTHTPKAGTVGMLAAKLSGVPHRLHTVAGMPLLITKGNKRKLLDIVEKLTYWCATGVYPNSYGLKDIIVKGKYTSEKKVKVLAKGSSNGIDTAYFDPCLISETQRVELIRSLGLTPDDFIFVAIGRIVRDKGINELITSFIKINQEFPNTKLILAGRFERDLDPLKPEIEDSIRTNKNIIHVGYQIDVRPYFSIADVFTFPTYREGFPNVLMQSCAMGIASITTDINGCNEIVQDGVNGLIIPPQDEKALYEKMLYLYQNPQYIRQLANNTRKRIIENYERTYVWSEILKEYQTLRSK